MKKIRLVEGDSIADLESKTNKVLEEIETDVEVRYMLPELIIALEYEVKKVKLMCADCQSYDNTQSVHKAWGVCQVCGKRIRFNEEPCDRFVDLRG